MSRRTASLKRSTDNSPPAIDPLLSPVDLSESLGIPIKTLYAWRLDGRGPPSIKVGKHVRYRRADVERWIESLA